MNYAVNAMHPVHPSLSEVEGGGTGEHAGPTVAEVGTVAAAASASAAVAAARQRDGRQQHYRRRGSNGYETAAVVATEAESDEEEDEEEEEGEEGEGKPVMRRALTRRAFALHTRQKTMRQKHEATLLVRLLEEVVTLLYECKESLDALPLDTTAARRTCSSYARWEDAGLRDKALDAAAAAAAAAVADDGEYVEAEKQTAAPAPGMHASPYTFGRETAAYHDDDIPNVSADSCYHASRERALGHNKRQHSEGDRGGQRRLSSDGDLFRTSQRYEFLPSSRHETQETMRRMFGGRNGHELTTGQTLARHLHAFVTRCLIPSIEKAKEETATLKASRAYIREKLQRSEEIVERQTEQLEELQHDLQAEREAEMLRQKNLAGALESLRNEQEELRTHVASVERALVQQRQEKATLEQRLQQALQQQEKHRQILDSTGSESTISDLSSELISARREVKRLAAAASQKDSLIEDLKTALAAKPDGGSSVSMEPSFSPLLSGPLLQSRQSLFRRQHGSKDSVDSSDRSSVPNGGGPRSPSISSDDYQRTHKRSPHISSRTVTSSTAAMHEKTARALEISTSPNVSAAVGSTDSEKTPSAGAALRQPDASGDSREGGAGAIAGDVGSLRWAFLAGHLPSPRGAALSYLSGNRALSQRRHMNDLILQQQRIGSSTTTSTTRSTAFPPRAPPLVSSLTLAWELSNEGLKRPSSQSDLSTSLFGSEYKHVRGRRRESATCSDDGGTILSKRRLHGDTSSYSTSASTDSRGNPSGIIRTSRIDSGSGSGSSSPNHSGSAGKSAAAKHLLRSPLIHQSDGRRWEQLQEERERQQMTAEEVRERLEEELLTAHRLANELREAQYESDQQRRDVSKQNYQLSLLQQQVHQEREYWERQLMQREEERQQQQVQLQMFECVQHVRCEWQRERNELQKAHELLERLYMQMEEHCVIHQREPVVTHVTTPQAVIREQQEHREIGTTFIGSDDGTPQATVPVVARAKQKIDGVEDREKGDLQRDIEMIVGTERRDSEQLHIEHTEAGRKMDLSERIDQQRTQEEENNKQQQEELKPRQQQTTDQQQRMEQRQCEKEQQHQQLADQQRRIKQQQKEVEQQHQLLEQRAMGLEDRSHLRLLQQQKEMYPHVQRLVQMQEMWGSLPVHSEELQQRIHIRGEHDNAQQKTFGRRQEESTKPEHGEIVQDHQKQKDPQGKQEDKALDQQKGKQHQLQYVGDTLQEGRDNSQKQLPEMQRQLEPHENDIQQQQHQQERLSQCESLQSAEIRYEQEPQQRQFQEQQRQLLQKQQQVMKEQQEQLEQQQQQVNEQRRKMEEQQQQFGQQQQQVEEARRKLEEQQLRLEEREQQIAEEQQKRKKEEHRKVVEQQRHLDEQQRKLEEQQGQFKDQQQQVKERQRQLDEQQRQVEQHQQQLDERRWQLDEQHRKLEEQQQTLEEHQRHAEEQQRQVEEQRRQVEEQQQHIEVEQRTFVEQQQKHEEQQRQLDEQKRQVKQHQHQQQQLAERHRQVEEEQRKLEEKQQTLEEQQRQVEEQQRQVEERQRQVEEQQQQIEVEHRKFEEQQQKLNEQQRQFEEQQQKAAKRQRQVEEQQKQAAKLQGQLEEQQRQLAEQLQRYEEQHRQFDRRQHTLEEQQRRLEEREGALDEQQHSLEEQQQELAKKQQQINDERQQVAEQRQCLEEKHRETKELAKKIEDLQHAQQQMSVLQQQLATAERDRRVKGRRMEAAEAVVGEKEKEIDSLQKELQRIKKEMESECDFLRGRLAEALAANDREAGPRGTERLDGNRGTVTATRDVEEAASTVLQQLQEKQRLLEKALSASQEKAGSLQSVCDSLREELRITQIKREKEFQSYKQAIKLRNAERKTQVRQMVEVNESLAMRKEEVETRFTNQLQDYQDDIQALIHLNMQNAVRRRSTSQAAGHCVQQPPLSSPFSTRVWRAYDQKFGESLELTDRSGSIRSTRRSGRPVDMYRPVALSIRSLRPHSRPEQETGADQNEPVLHFSREDSASDDGRGENSLPMLDFIPSLMVNIRDTLFNDDSQPRRSDGQRPQLQTGLLSGDSGAASLTRHWRMRQSVAVSPHVGTPTSSARSARTPNSRVRCTGGGAGRARKHTAE